LAFAAVFYHAGALVFGGGHVVLPLLRQELVPEGWVSDNRFLAGYWLAQGLPGPLFTVAAYLGTVSAPEHLSGPWAVLALVAVFLPGLLLATGAMSLLSVLVRFPAASAALAWHQRIRGGNPERGAVQPGLAWRIPAPVIVAMCVVISVLRQSHFL
jgi:chromate transporter